MRVVALMVMGLGLSSGCVVGQTISFHEVTPVLRAYAPAPLPLALVVQDQRPEVTISGKRPEFVGLLRAGFGNPWDVTTTSEKAFAEDVMGGIVRGLAARGYTVTPVATEPSMTLAQVSEEVAKSGRARALVVQLTRWKSDTYVGTKLRYDVTARVLSVSKGVLGAARIVGEESLGSAFFDPKGLAQREVPIAYQAKLEALLNAPQIVAALTPPPVAAPAAPPEAEPPPARAETPASPPGSN